jgi:Tfp pilus assembly protein PilW
MNLRRSNFKLASLGKTSGFTLPEMMISVAAGMLILASVMTVFIFINRALDATGNYEELDRQSRRALDLMSQDIRQCGHMTSFSTNSLSFTNLDGSLLQYTWDTTNFVTYTNASTNMIGCPRGGLLLKGCSYLKFSIFQRNPIAGTTMTFTPCASTNINLVKCVVMDWICKRTNYTSLTDSESVQTAKVVMRN